MVSVWRTQLSGDSESRHIRRNTRRPCRAPAKYQAKSAIRLAIVATAITCGTVMSAARSDGTDDDERRVGRHRQPALQCQDVGEHEPEAVLLDQGQEKLHAAIVGAPGCAGRKSTPRRNQGLRPNQSTDRDAAASTRIAATTASSAVISVSRVSTCRREPRSW